MTHICLLCIGSLFGVMGTCPIYAIYKRCVRDYLTNSGAKTRSHIFSYLCLLPFASLFGTTAGVYDIRFV